MAMNSDYSVALTAGRLQPLQGDVVLWLQSDYDTDSHSVLYFGTCFCKEAKLIFI